MDWRESAVAVQHTINPCICATCHTGLKLFEDLMHVCGCMNIAVRIHVYGMYDLLAGVIKKVSFTYMYPYKDMCTCAMSFHA